MSLFFKKKKKARALLHASRFCEASPRRFFLLLPSQNIEIASKIKRFIQCSHQLKNAVQPKLFKKDLSNSLMPQQLGKANGDQTLRLR